MPETPFAAAAGVAYFASPGRFIIAAKFGQRERRVAARPCALAESNSQVHGKRIRRTATSLRGSAVSTMFLMKLVCLSLLASVSAFAQPYINYRGIVNVASYMPPGLPSGSLARGGMVAIFGSKLGPAAGVQASAFPLGTTLSGVSVTVTQNTTTVNAYPVYVSASQINAILPSNAPLGRVTLQATVNGVSGNPSPANMVAASFGAFSINSGGFGPGIIQNNTSSGPVINSTQITAVPGQVETLWGTGLGAVAQDNVAPTVGNLPVQVEVFVGGQPATIAYSGRTSCCSGIDQINFTVPTNAPAGCYVPVVVRLGGTVVSNTVTMAIDPKGVPCSDPANPLGVVFRNGGRLGAAWLKHDNITINVEGAAQTFKTDYGSVTLRQEAGGVWAFNPYVSPPPIGTCTSYAIAGEYPVLNDAPGLTPSVKDLSAGPALSISDPAGTVNLPQGAGPPVFYSALFADSANLTGVLSSFFTAGTVTSLSSPGGTGVDVGPFQAAVTPSASFNWTNQAAISSVTRSAGLTVTWSNVPAGAPFVSIIGYNVDQAHKASGGFQCIADPAAGTFTVPPIAMGNVPPTPANGPANLGFLKVGVPLLGSAAAFSAAGLDQGVAVFGTSDQQAVVFQ